ncbi:hypothetical protein O181_093564, partial [Austropuccinia psidii MF-1]|nr:hypothetical protein [Austropuccinia psidii MF-1]
MGEFTLELNENDKLNDSNYLDWVSRMESILTLKNYYGLVTNSETPEETANNDKLEPRRRQRAAALLKINCIVRLGNKFYADSKKDPAEFWRLTQEFFQPKTIQNQTTYLNKIFSTQLNDEHIRENMSTILENTLHLRTLFCGLTISPEDLIDSVIAMWVIINIPEKFKTTMEVWLGKCEVEKKSPSLDDTWEVIRKFLQRNENGTDQTNQALAALKNQKQENNNLRNQNKRRQDGDYPKCAPGWHNPLTKHDESECNFLKDKNRNSKPVKSLVVSTSKTTTNQIILDSGATTSMFNNSDLFTNFTPNTQTIELADGSTIHSAGTGTVKIELPHCFLELKNCLLVKSLAYNLISLGAIMKPNFKITTNKNKTFDLQDQNNELILNGTYNSGNFELSVNQNTALAVKTTNQLAKILHQSAGHPSQEHLKTMFPNNNFDNLTCKTCSLAKITKTPFKGHFPPPEQKLQFVHADLFGPIETPSNSGYEYCLRVMDGYSRYVWVVFLRSKSDVGFHLQKLFNRIKCQSNLKIANFISDNGTEFKNQKLNQLFESKGITHLTTAPYTPQQNPFAERGNQTTTTKGRCLLIDSGLNQTFWAEAVRTAAYLENLTPKKVLNLSTPYQQWYNRTPSYKHLQPFGCKCVFLNNIQQGKFTERGSEGIFLGYEEGHRAYQILEGRT